jgi:hypothetical protein
LNQKIKKHLLLIVILACSVDLFSQNGAVTDFRNWALTPPMGWNSFDCFGAGASETQILENTEYMPSESK